MHHILILQFYHPYLYLGTLNNCSGIWPLRLFESSRLQKRSLNNQSDTKLMKYTLKKWQSSRNHYFTYTLIKIGRLASDSGIVPLRLFWLNVLVAGQETDTFKHCTKKNTC